MECEKMRDDRDKKASEVQFDHLASCPDCQVIRDSDVGLRQRIKSAGMTGPAFAMPERFSARLRSDLRSEFFTEERPRSFRVVKIFVPVFSLLMVAAGLGIYQVMSYVEKDTFGSYLSEGMNEIAHVVAGNHVYCTLEKLGMWERLSTSDYPDKEKYEQIVAAPLKAAYSSSISLLSAHMCTFEGKEFRHIVLRDGGSIVSIFVNETDEVTVNRSGFVSPIISKVEDGFQIATFAGKRRAIFVVSNLRETENLIIARTLSYSMNQPDQSFEF